MADMVDEADWPDDVVGIGMGLVADMPETGSDLEDGQIPFAGFLRGPHPP